METTQTTSLVPATPIQVVHTDHSVHTHAGSKGISTGFYVASFLILLLILVFFGDLFVFVLGLLGLVAIYAGYFSEKSANEEHH